MIWSKIVYFFVATTGALALCVALLMPRPAERQAFLAEEARTERARSHVVMLLRDNARLWIDLALGFARTPAPPGQTRLKLDSVLEAASNDASIASASSATARDTLQYILSQVSGAQKPEFVMAIDKWGRVVANVGAELHKTGDDVSGYFLVRDALRGYLRDDLWFDGGKLYRVAAAPVIERVRSEYVGALVLGDEVDLTLVSDLKERVGAHVAFFSRGETIAVSLSDPTVTKEILAAYDKGQGPDGLSSVAFTLGAGNAARYLVAWKELPGEVGARDGFLAVFTPAPEGVGLMGTLKSLTKDDVTGGFPWLWIGIGFFVVLVGGMALMIVEIDRPLRRLLLAAVNLGKGAQERIPEGEHKGKFGSIARCVNTAIERVERETRQAPQSADLGAVLGPPPDQGSYRPSPDDFQFPSAPAPPPVPARGFPEPMMARPPAPPPFDIPPPRGPAMSNDGRARPASLPPPSSSALPQMGAPTFGAPVAPESMHESFLTNEHTGARRPDPFAAPPLGSAPAAGRARRKTQSIALSSSVSDEELMASTTDLLALTAGTDELMPVPQGGGGDFGGETVIANPSEDLIKRSADGVDPEAAAFEKVYSEFLTLKRRCGESIDGLTLEKFAEKLRKNREQLVSKYQCKAVKFQVYVKDGKAALKATPIR